MGSAGSAYQAIGTAFWREERIGGIMHSGKKTAVVAAGPVGNSQPSAKLVLQDTIYYQIDKHGDFVQEKN